jgi:hypothetical protein
MNAAASTPHSNGRYALRYESLHQLGRCLLFPCDEAGRIDLDTLPELARINYLAARAMVGRDFAHPVVEAQAGAPALS